MRNLDVQLNITQRVEQFHPLVETSSSQVVIGGDLNTNPYLWEGFVPILPEQATTDSDQAVMFDDYMTAHGFDTPTAGSGVTQTRLCASFASIRSTRADSSLASLR